MVTTLRGDATVARVSLAQPLALRTRDDVLLHDRITTREHSLVHVLLRDRALLTVRELSVLSITEGAARAMVDLRSGKVGLVVARNLMRPGEVVELHTPNVVVAVRGTVFVVEIVPSVPGAPPTSGAAAVTTRIYLLQGNLDVSLRNDPTAAPVQLNSLQAVEITDDTIGTVRSLSSDAAVAATRGLTVGDLFRPGPPAAFLSALVAQQQAIVGAPGALVRGTIRDTLTRATSAEGRTTGIGLGGSTGAAPTGGPLSGPGPLLPIQLPTELLPGR